MSFNTTFHMSGTIQSKAFDEYGSAAQSFERCLAKFSKPAQWFDVIDDRMGYSDLYKDTYGVRPRNVHLNTQHGYSLIEE